MNAAPEYFDVVTEEGQVVGKASREECHGDPSLIHRAVHVIICNSRGDILLQKRSPAKKIQPGKWDTSVGGHVISGNALRKSVFDAQGGIDLGFPVNA